MDDIKRNIVAGLIVFIAISVVAALGANPLVTAAAAGGMALALLLGGPSLSWVRGRLASAWNAARKVVNKPFQDKLDDLETRIASQETLLRSIQVRLASPPRGEDKLEAREGSDHESD